MMLSHKYRHILLASLLLGPSVHAFAPNCNRAAVTKSTETPFLSSSSTSHGLQVSPSLNYHPFKLTPKSLTSLHMASDDWNEAKYTESAWACIVALTKAADYYANNTVDSPMLLDVLLNPTKHSAGDDADSAKRTVEKVLLKAGLDVSKLRQDLEIHMSKQPKLSGSSDQQKVMGRNMIKLLEFARDTKQILGVSFVSWLYDFYDYILNIEYDDEYYDGPLIF